MSETEEAIPTASAQARTLLYFVTEDWYFVSHRIDLSVAASRAGYDVSVLTRVNSHGDVVRDAGLRLIPIRLSRGSLNPFTDLLLLVRLIRVYRELRPDVVHHVAMKPVVYGSIAARLAGVPRVINAMAGLGLVFTSTRILARLLKPIIRLVLSALLDNDRSTLILQNPDDVREFTNHRIVDPARIALIYGSGVDPEIYTYVPESDETPVVIIPTRMIWDKGVGEFVRAAEILKGQNCNARFVLAGDTDPQNPARIPPEQLQEWNDAGVVEWWGYCSDMPEVFGKSHIVCLPTSYGEGVPKVLIEAASCGRPIVTTDAPGCREIVHDGVNGLLVPEKNARALAAAIRKLLDSAVLRDQMGQAGRELVLRQFSLEKVIASTMLLYEEPKS